MSDKGKLSEAERAKALEYWRKLREGKTGQEKPEK